MDIVRKTFVLNHKYANNMQWGLAEAAGMPGNIAAAHAQYDLVIPLESVNGACFDA